MIIIIAVSLFWVCVLTFILVIEPSIGWTPDWLPEPAGTPPPQYIVRG